MDWVRKSENFGAADADSEMTFPAKPFARQKTGFAEIRENQRPHPKWPMVMDIFLKTPTGPIRAGSFGDHLNPISVKMAGNPTF